MLEIVKRWTCNVCRKAVERERPPGWTWVRFGGELGHRCPECEKGRAPSEDKGTPLGQIRMKGA